MGKNRQKTSAVGNTALGVLLTGKRPFDGRDHAFFWECFKKWMTSIGGYSVSPETLPEDGVPECRVTVKGESGFPAEVGFELRGLAAMTANEFEARLLDGMRVAAQREFNETFKL